MTPPTYRTPYSQLSTAEVRETWRRFQSAATHSTPESFDDGMDEDEPDDIPDNARRVEGIGHE